MRTAAETLQERAPEELTIDNIERELIQNLHMQQENAASWVTAVRAHFASVSSVPHDVVTAKEIMGLSMGEMHAVCFEAGLTRGDLNNIAIVLGSTTSPFQWESKRTNPTSLVVVYPEDDVKMKVQKGGSKDNVAEQLLMRRRSGTSYFPPAQFDAHRLYAQTRDETKLRVLVVQEVYRWCGDLYPDLEEKKVVLGAIEAHCGTQPI
jgi:hypothetical protein